jgi:hypothetical protein
MPKKVPEALAFDKRSGTNFWQKAIEKEMLTVMPAFEFCDNNNILIGYTKITCQIIFDVKQDLTCKARLVAGGHHTELPKESVYSSVIACA